MTTQEVERVSRAPVKKELDHVSDRFLLLVEKKRVLKAMIDEVGKLEKEIREQVGDAEEATVFGETVITNYPINRFKEREFEKDNPGLYKQFVKPRLVDRFDAEAFQKEHPNLYDRYRSRQFLFKEK